METQVRLVEAKLLRNSRNRRFRTIAIDPADRLAANRQFRLQTDFTMASQNVRGATRRASEPSRDRSMEFWSK